MKKIATILRWVAAAILLQTLFFKFTGAEESKFIFSSLGVEPFGRWFAGISELIAVFLLLIPSTRLYGAVMSIGIMAGAILSHLAVLGIVVQDDGGLLFALACIVAVASALSLLIERQELKQEVQRWLPQRGV